VLALSVVSLRVQANPVRVHQFTFVEPPPEEEWWRRELPAILVGVGVTLGVFWLGSRYADRVARRRDG
ncbi:MAG TPA: hypothetical protein VM529_02425, partial [Gemmata sp.]|nr:hypothetical protein [Gemmata sp.]